MKEWFQKTVDETVQELETDLNQGGWSKRITGIWVGKFEVTGTSKTKARKIWPK